MNTETTEQDKKLARAGMYAMLSGVLLREFDEQTLRTLHTSEWAETLAELKISVPPVNQETIEELAIDYCRIFVGPKECCPPCQSVWDSGHFQGQVIESMNDFLEIVVPESRVAIKDHAGIQFEMMAIILRYEAAHTDESTGLSESFFRNHIAWAESMFARAAGFAETLFYQNLLEMGSEFVGNETSQIQTPD